jgi:hypothetical protein
MHSVQLYIHPWCFYCRYRSVTAHTVGNFLTIWANISFSRWTLPQYQIHQNLFIIFRHKVCRQTDTICTHFMQRLIILKREYLETYKTAVHTWTCYKSQNHYICIHRTKPTCDTCQTSAVTASLVEHNLWPWVVLHSGEYCKTKGHSSHITKLDVCNDS